MSIRPRAVLALAAAVLAVIGFGAIAAGAQESPEEPLAPAFAAVTGVDARGEQVEVAVVREDYDVSASDVSVVENGAAVDGVSVTSAVEAGTPVEIVYVIDTDNRGMVGATLSSVTNGIRTVVEDLAPEIEVGLVTAGVNAEIATRPTANRDRYIEELQAVAAEEGSAVLDGVAYAAETFDQSANAVRTVIVITTGGDTTSEGSLLAAESAMIQAGAQLVWISVGSNAAGLDRIAERTGGLTAPVADVAGFDDMIGRATAVATDRLVVSFDGAAETGERGGVALTIAESTIEFSYPAGLNSTNPLQLVPLEMEVQQETGILGHPAVLYLSVGLAFLAVALAVWTLGTIFLSGETSLDNMLARYSEKDDSLDEDEIQEMLVQTALVRRAVDMTETFAERRGFLVRIEELLERANLPIAAGEAMFFLSALVVVLTGVSLVVTGSVIAALIVGMLAGVGGYLAVVMMARRRMSQFSAQLPDALQLLAGTLRAGYSLPQGLDAVSIEIADPMGQELRRAITEVQLGRELEEALTGIAERLDSPDFAWAVMAIGIQREVGGNLAEVLLTVAETMIQRERLSREVSALTAEGRVSAGILSMLPPGLGLVMWVMNPGYIGILFSRTLGLVLIGLAVASGLTGLIWMKKVITIDV
ncbi:MAG: type II secretion system F family protein [Actinomycetota bacterium]